MLIKDRKADSKNYENCHLSSIPSSASEEDFQPGVIDYTRQLFRLYRVHPDSYVLK